LRFDPGLDPQANAHPRSADQALERSKDGECVLDCLEQNPVSERGRRWADLEETELQPALTAFRFVFDSAN
jgi:hypothetical protein